MLNACLLKSAADLNCIHNEKFVVTGMPFYKSFSDFDLKYKIRIYSIYRCVLSFFHSSFFLFTHLLIKVFQFTYFSGTNLKMKNSQQSSCKPETLGKFSTETV